MVLLDLNTARRLAGQKMDNPRMQLGDVELSRVNSRGARFLLRSPSFLLCVTDPLSCGS